MMATTPALDTLRERSHSRRLARPLLVLLALLSLSACATSAVDRSDEPGTTEVEVHATWSPFPGDKAKFRHGYRAEAPDWEVEPITAEDFKKREGAE